MGVGQELTNGLKGVGHVFSYMLKQKKSPHINNDRSLNPGCCLRFLVIVRAVKSPTPPALAALNPRYVPGLVGGGGRFQLTDALRDL